MRFDASGELIEHTIEGVPVRLGDKFERLVKPIAKALRLPCLDEKGNLKADSGCARRRDRLNKLTAA